MTAEDRVLEYFRSFGMNYPVSDPLGSLIDSHRRQRAVIGQDTDARLLFHHRWRFIPFKIRLWVGGWR